MTATAVPSDLRVRLAVCLVLVILGSTQGGWMPASPYTAKTHVNRIMAKVGARDRAQLVVVAYQTGFTPG